MWDARLLRQEFVVEAAAVANAVARRVKGQPGHQDQGVGIVRLRTVCQRFRNAAVPGGDVLQIGEPDKTHGVSKHFGYGNPLSAVQRRLKELQGMHFLIIRQIAINGPGGLVKGTGQSHPGQLPAAALNLSRSHGRLLTPNFGAQCFFIHRQNSFLFRLYCTGKGRIRQSKRKMLAA